jgi:hypothetical protein
MKKTLQDQYLLIKEGKGHKGVFLTEAKRQFPNIVRNAATFEEAAASLITKNIISENVVGMTTVAGYEPRKKESYETAFEAFLAEAKKKENEDEKVKAEEKKVSKPVEKDLAHNYNNSDEKNPDNMIFGQIMMGYYAEMKDPKNSEKTMEELKDMVFKNLAKDPIYYTKNAQFGIKDLGYTDEATALGIPKEAKGKYKSSGYGDLKEALDPVVAQSMSGIKYEFEKKPTKSDRSSEELKSVIDKRNKEREEELRKVIREIIDEELEEAYQLKNINIKAPKKEPKDEPTENAKYISIPDGIMKLLIERGYIIIDEDGVFVSGRFVANLDKLLNYDTASNEKMFFSSPMAYSLEPTTKTNIYTGAQEPYKQISPSKSSGIRIVSEKIPEFRTNDEGDVKIVPPVDSKLLFQAIVSPESWRAFTAKPKKFEESLREVSLDVIDNDVEPAYFKNLPISYNDDKSVAHYSDDYEYDNQDDLLNVEDYLDQIKGMSKGDAFDYLKEMGLERDEILTVLRNHKSSSLRESVEKDLAAINKEAEHEVLQSKMDKIQDLIDKKQSQLSKLDEDEDMKSLTDDKKVKEISKDIKALEKAKAKLEKLMSKSKGKGTKKEVIDEMDNAEEAVEDIAPDYIEDANKRLRDKESIDSILSNYPNLSDGEKDDLRNYLEWQKGSDIGQSEELDTYES